MELFNGFLPQLLLGTWITIQVACGSLILGLLFGLLGALAESSKNTFLRYTATSIISIIRGLPELVVLFIIYFGATYLFIQLAGPQANISAFLAGIFSLALIFGAYASQIFRGAFLAVPFGQIEAARALGLNNAQIFIHIQLPQAWRFALPGLGNLWLVLLKDTALVSLIGLGDLMNKAQLATNATQKPFLFYLTAAFIYLILTSVSQIVMHKLNRKAKKYIL